MKKYIEKCIVILPALSVKRACVFPLQTARCVAALSALVSKVHVYEVLARLQKAVSE